MYSSQTINTIRTVALIYTAYTFTETMTKRRAGRKALQILQNLPEEESGSDGEVDLVSKSWIQYSHILDGENDMLFLLNYRVKYNNQIRMAILTAWRMTQ